MACEEYREIVLEVATDSAARCRIAEALAHVEQCDSCRAVLADFDRIAAALKAEPEPTMPEPATPDSLWGQTGRRRVDGALSSGPSSSGPSSSGASSSGASSSGALSSGANTRHAAGSNPADSSAPRAGTLAATSGSTRDGGTILRMAAACGLAVAGFFVGQWTGQATGSGQWTRKWTGQPSVSSPAMLTAGKPSGPTGFTPVARSSRAFAIDRSEIVHDATAFARVSKSLDGRAQWLLVSDTTEGSDSGASSRGDYSGLGFSDRPLDTDPRASDFIEVLRLTMLQDNRVVSSIDLAIIPGQSADLTLPLPTGNSVHYRAGTARGNDSRLNLLAQITTASENKPMAALSTTQDIRQNVAISVGQMQTQAGLYELCIAFSRAENPCKRHP